MSQTVAPDFLLTTRGVQRELGAFVVGTTFNRAGTAVAFALGVCVCVVCRLRSHGSVFRLDHERSLQTTARLLP